MNNSEKYRRCAAVIETFLDDLSYIEAEIREYARREQDIDIKGIYNDISYDVGKIMTKIQRYLTIVDDWKDRPEVL